MKYIKRKFNQMIRNTIITSLFLMIIGVLLIAKPEEILTMISIVLGVGIMIVGIFGFLNYANDLKEGRTMSMDIIYGIICVIVGALLIINTKIFASILPIVLGIWMVINSIIKAQYTLLLKDEGNSNWKITLIFSVLTLACGILFIFNPFKTASMFMQIFGAIMVIYSIMDVVNVIILKKNIKSFENDVKEDIKEVKKEIENIKEQVQEAKYEEVEKKERETKPKKATKKKSATKKASSKKS